MIRERTLHGSLRPRRGEQAHASDHEVLKRLVTTLGPLAHVILEARDLGGRVVLIVLEGRVEGRRPVVLARDLVDGGGFRSPLLLLLLAGEALWGG